MHNTQSKAWAVKILSTGSQISHFHTHTHTKQQQRNNLLCLPVGLLFTHGETLLAGYCKHNLGQPIRGRVSNEVISTRRLRGVQSWKMQAELLLWVAMCKTTKEIRWATNISPNPFIAGSWALEILLREREREREREKEREPRARADDKALGHRVEVKFET